MDHDRPLPPSHRTPTMAFTNDRLGSAQSMTTPNPHTPLPDPQDLGPLEVYQSYMRSPYLSRKHSSYFQTYTDLFERYRGKELTFVEIGVMDGGSLFMWRDYLGPKARIIGIELNPGAKRWQQDGFEIFTGSQSDPQFWRSFFQTVGPGHVRPDDGGHTFEQQIVTVHSCIPNVRDGGMIVV